MRGQHRLRWGPCLRTEQCQPRVSTIMLWEKQLPLAIVDAFNISIRKFYANPKGYFTLPRVLFGEYSQQVPLASEFQGGKWFMRHFLLLRVLQCCVCRPHNLVSAAYHSIHTFRPILSPVSKLHEFVQQIAEYRHFIL